MKIKFAITATYIYGPDPNRIECDDQTFKYVGWADGSGHDFVWHLADLAGQTPGQAARQPFRGGAAEGCDRGSGEGLFIGLTAMVLMGRSRDGSRKYELRIVYDCDRN